MHEVMEGEMEELAGIRSTLLYSTDLSNIGRRLGLQEDAAAATRRATSSPISAANRPKFRVAHRAGYHFKS